MGCGESRTKSSEEKGILHEEASLKFSTVDVNHLDMIIRKNSSRGLVNNFQLQRIAKTLKIETKDYKNHSKIASFYNKMKDESGEIPERDLLVLGILLGKGSPATKSRLLFQVFDEDARETLPLDQVKNGLFRCVSRIAILLTFLVPDKTNVYSNELKISAYAEKLKSIERDVIDDCGERLNTKANDYNVTETRFIGGFGLMQEGTLTTPTGWRTFLYERFLSAPPKKVTYNPFARKK